MTSSPSRIRRVVLVVAVLAVGATGWVVSQRLTRHPSATRPNTAAKPRGPDPRAALPAWAQDPDADPGTVTGIVRAPQGIPVAGALVALFPDLGGARENARIKPAATARSGADGRFRLHPVRPGEYGITATADGFAGAHRSDLSMLPGATLDGVELTLEGDGVVLEGRVSDSGGGPIPRAELRISDGLSGQKQTRIFQVITDDGGKYRVTLARGPHSITADADGYAPSSRLVDTAMATTADFALNPAARLAGRVVEKAGQTPVAAASIDLTEGNGWWQAPRTASSDASGRFEFRDLDAGEYRVSARKGNLVSVSGAVEVALADRTAEVLVELSAGRAILGRAIEAGPVATPVAGARIRLTSGSFGVMARGRTMTGPDGSFRLEGLLPERYTLSAESRGRATATREVVTSGVADLTGIDLVLAPEAVVVGQVVGSEGKAVAGVTVTGWLQESGASIQNPGRWAADRTDAQGGFRLGSLAAGQLTIDAQERDHGHASHGPEPIAAGEQKVLKLTLQPGAMVRGTVHWDDGQPAGGVQVMAMVPGSMGMAQTKSGPDGTYQVGPLPAGRAMVIASRQQGYGALLKMDPRKTKQMQSVTLEGNERKSGVDLVLEKGGHRVAGIVLSPEGKPLAGASVGADSGLAPMRGMQAAFGAMLGEKPVLSGEDGRFVIEDLGPGPYQVRAKLQGYPDAAVAKVATDATEVRIQFARAAELAGVAVDPQGKPVPDFTVVANESESPGDSGAKQIAVRAMASMNSFFGGSAPAVHDPGGAFELRALAAATYDVVVSTADGRIGRLAAVTVAAGERKSGLRVTVKKGTSLRGKLVEFAKGKPVPGAMVMVMSDQAPVMRNSGDDGTFSIDGLAGGATVRLVYGGPRSGFVSDQREVKIPAEAPAVDLGQIKLLRGEERPHSGLRSLGLTVRVESGNPEVLTVRRGSVAEGAGVKAGERISAVDGAPVDGLGENSLEQLLDRPPGTAIEISLTDPRNPQERTVHLTRGPDSPGKGSAPPPR